MDDEQAGVCHIGRHLQTAAHLIAGYAAIPVIKVSHGGFDTDYPGQQSPWAKDAFLR
jgi:hypothetical protein